VQRLLEALVGIAGSYTDAGEPAGLQPLDEPVPAAFGLAVGQVQPQELALPIGPDADAEHDGGRPHGALATDLRRCIVAQLHRVKEHKGVRLPIQRALRPRIDLFVEVFAETRDRRSGKLATAKLGGDLLDTAGGDALSRSHEIYVHHLDQGEHQRLQTDTSVTTSDTGQRERSGTCPPGRAGHPSQEFLRKACRHAW